MAGKILIVIGGTKQSSITSITPESKENTIYALEANNGNLYCHKLGDIDESDAQEYKADEGVESILIDLNSFDAPRDPLGYFLLLERIRDLHPNTENIYAVHKIFSR